MDLDDAIDRMFTCATAAQHSLDVCPHCKRALVSSDCPEHGAVPPMRSAIVNHYPPPDWSAA